MGEAVSWKGNRDLSSLKGERVSIRIQMAWARLFSAWI
jgi:hypothetical protein